jgi:hypothetical protein
LPPFPPQVLGDRKHSTNAAAAVWISAALSPCPCGSVDVGATLQAFQASDLLAVLGNNLFQGSDFAEQFNQQSLKLWTA